MNEFVHRHAGSVTGCLSGFDRVLFRGTYRLLAHVGGLMSCLWAWRVLLKDFGGWAAAFTSGVRAAGERGMIEAGRWAVNGFRNADVRAELFGPDGKDVNARRRRAGQVTRRLAMLRTHGLVKRVPKTRRWLLTDRGREVATLLTAAEHASAETLATDAA